MLRNAQVYTTESICSVLELSQGRISHKVEQSSDVHVGEKNCQLQIFVSRQQRKQDFAYSSQLNYHLFRWLMTNTATQPTEKLIKKPEKLDPRGLLTVQKILNSRRSVLQQVLEEDGIVTGHIKDLDQDIQCDGSLEDNSSSDDEDTTEPVKRLSSAYYNDSGDGNAEELQYGNALRHIVLTARKSQFPVAGSFNMSAMSLALVDNEIDRVAAGQGGLDYSRAFNSASPLVRDKIGAAGELFVCLEYLIVKFSKELRSLI